MMVRALLSLFLLLHHLGLPLVASAADDKPADRLAVLPIIIAGGEKATVSSVFDAVTEAASLRPSLRVMSIDDYYFNEGGELANRAVGCGEDTACIAKQLAPFNAQIGLVVIINLEIEPPLLSFIMLRIKERSVAKEAYGELPGAASLPEVIKEKATELFEELGYHRSGRIVVEAEPSNADISISTGQPPNIGSPNVFTVPPGRYEIFASIEGYEPTKGTAEVKSGGTTTVELQLVEQTSIWDSPWFWGVSAGVLLAGAATATTLVLYNNRGQCICVITKGNDDCSECQ